MSSEGKCAWCRLLVLRLGFGLGTGGSRLCERLKIGTQKRRLLEDPCLQPGSVWMGVVPSQIPPMVKCTAVAPSMSNTSTARMPPGSMAGTRAIVPLLGLGLGLATHNRNVSGPAFLPSSLLRAQPSFFLAMDRQPSFLRLAQLILLSLYFCPLSMHPRSLAFLNHLQLPNCNCNRNPTHSHK